MLDDNGIFHEKIEQKIQSLTHTCNRGKNGQCRNLSKTNFGCSLGCVTLYIYVGVCFYYDPVNLVVFLMSMKRQWRSHKVVQGSTRPGSQSGYAAQTSFQVHCQICHYGLRRDFLPNISGERGLFFFYLGCPNDLIVTCVYPPPIGQVQNLTDFKTFG